MAVLPAQITSRNEKLKSYIPILESFEKHELPIPTQIASECNCSLVASSYSNEQRLLPQRQAGEKVFYVSSIPFSEEKGSHSNKNARSDNYALSNPHFSRKPLCRYLHCNFCEFWQVNGTH